MPQCGSATAHSRLLANSRNSKGLAPLGRYTQSQALLRRKLKLANGYRLGRKLETFASSPDPATVQLATTCAVLFVGATGAGLLPIIVKTSARQLRLLSAVGAGLLCGTGLSVILPEGFEAFSKAQHSTGDDALPEAMQGLALLAGFLAMLLLDVLHKAVSMETSPHDRGSPSASQADHRHEDHEQRNHIEPASPAAASSNPMSLAIGRSDEATRALVGLIIHSAADGLAVGASSLSSDRQLTTLIALAMVLHKMPAAIGLTSYLRGRSWPFPDTVKALVIFAAATPLVALACAAVLQLSPDFSSTPQAIALCLIFSGGTFLYAACLHVLPESLSGKGRFAVAQAGCVVAASCLPLIFNFFHHH